MSASPAPPRPLRCLRHHCLPLPSLTSAASPALSRGPWQAGRGAARRFAGRLHLGPLSIESRRRRRPDGFARSASSSTCPSPSPAPHLPPPRLTSPPGRRSLALRSAGGDGAPQNRWSGLHGSISLAVIVPLPPPPLLGPGLGSGRAPASLAALAMAAPGTSGPAEDRSGHRPQWPCVPVAPRCLLLCRPLPLFLSICGARTRGHGAARGPCSRVCAAVADGRRPGPPPWRIWPPSGAPPPWPERRPVVRLRPGERRHGRSVVLACAGPMARGRRPRVRFHGQVPCLEALPVMAWVATTCSHPPPSSPMAGSRARCGPWADQGGAALGQPAEPPANLAGQASAVSWQTTHRAPSRTTGCGGSAIGPEARKSDCVPIPSISDLAAAAPSSSPRSSRRQHFVGSPWEKLEESSDCMDEVDNSHSHNRVPHRMAKECKNNATSYKTDNIQLAKLMIEHLNDY